MRSLAFSCFVSLLLTVFTFQNSVLAKPDVKPDAKPEVVKIELVRPWDLRRLNAQQRLHYFRALQTLVTTLENATDGKAKNRNAMSFILPQAIAMPKAGDDCAIGGYVSTWYRRTEGNLSCKEPGEAQMFDVTVSPKKFFCGGAGDKGDSRQAYCNSAVFLFASDEGQRFCQPLKGLSANCQTAFEERYGKPGSSKSAMGLFLPEAFAKGSGDPNYPARFNRDFEIWAKNLDPRELDQRLEEFETRLNTVMEGNDFDPRTTEALRRQIGIMKETKERITTAKAIALEAQVAGNQNSPNPNDPSFSPNGQFAGNGSTARVGGNPMALNGTTFSSTGAPPNPFDTDDTSGEIAKKTKGTANDNPVAQPPPQDPNKVLGPELSCVQDGLKKLGYTPSGKYLALLGIGVQASNGAYDGKQETSRKAFQSRVISMVQAYGFCDEKSYPSNKLKANHISLMRRWLNADSGRATARPGMSYIKQMLDPQSQDLAARNINEIFGLRSNFNDKKKTATENFDQSVEKAFGSLFTPDEKEWEKQSLADRQARLHNWKEASPKSEFASCQKNAQARKDADKGFKLQALRMPAADQNGKRAAITDDQRTQIQNVYSENMKICKSMAESCGVDPVKACSSADVPGIATSGPGQTSPPAAPSVQPKKVD